VSAFRDGIVRRLRLLGTAEHREAVPVSRLIRDEEYWSWRIRTLLWLELEVDDHIVSARRLLQMTGKTEDGAA
jgi:hypothetical protein